MMKIIDQEGCHFGSIYQTSFKSISKKMLLLIFAIGMKMLLMLLLIYSTLIAYGNGYFYSRLKANRSFFDED